MPRRVLQGKVVSSKADKTIKVAVVRKHLHKTYKKTIQTTKNYAVHDEHNKYKEGDTVTFIETRPLSKTKTWIVVEE
jgi:small subunit ribosomal protein S17